MRATKYTIVVADRTTGVIRRLTVGLRPAVFVIASLLALPVLIGMGAAWKAKADVAELQANAAALELENASYRDATAALAGQIQGLQAAIGDLGARSALDPSLASAMDKLPAIVKARAMGGTDPTTATSKVFTPGINSPEDTFGLLRDLLAGLENRLRNVRHSVERREALARATPSIWPAQGWISSTAGARKDPFTGENAVHEGLDISADRGQSVYATAAGTVTTASYQGDYGNLVVIDHGFGLETRYGHLSGFKVRLGQTVGRGDLVGLVGSTGRSTGFHLHYEVRANGRLLNPLQLLLQNPRR